jgi:hypothetical protein
MISWHRFYDPETGRYISADPIGLQGGLNLYAYANQNPINATDPYGLYSWTDLNAAWSNYCGGSRTPWFATFGSIDWGNYEVDLKAKISTLVGGGSCCKPKNSYETFTIGAQTGGADRFLIGRHNLKAEGRLIVNADCSWSFSGTISSASGVDPYNFNSSNRGFVGETTTWIGRNRCPSSGRTFDINIVGVGYVNLSGK